MSGTLLDGLYVTNYDEMMRTLVLESRIFGVTIFGDGATITNTPLINILAATSLVSLLSLQKINNILSQKSLPCSRPLWLHYLGEMIELKVKLTFYPTLLSLWITAMPSIKALGAA